MAIDTRINKAMILLNQVRHCNEIIMSRSFNNSTKDGLKDEMKDILDEVKGEVDQIKDEVDNW